MHINLSPVNGIFACSTNGCWVIIFVVNEKIIAENRKARHDYSIFDKFEAGIQLKGSEVKSIREGRVNLADSYVRILNGEVFLVNLHIAQYSHAHLFVPDPTRTRKLLLQKKQIKHLETELTRKGFACLPLQLYFKRGFVKVEIAFAKRKKEYDKREVLKERAHQKEIKKALKKDFRKT